MVLVRKVKVWGHGHGTYTKGVKLRSFEGSEVAVGGGDVVILVGVLLEELGHCTVLDVRPRRVLRQATEVGELAVVPAGEGPELVELAVQLARAVAPRPLSGTLDHQRRLRVVLGMLYQLRHDEMATLDLL